MVANLQIRKRVRKGNLGRRSSFTLGTCYSCL